MSKRALSSELLAKSYELSGIEQLKVEMHRRYKPITKAPQLNGPAPAGIQRDRRNLESTKIRTSISRPLPSEDLRVARVAEEDEKSLDAENTHKDAEALNASKLAFPASPSLCVTCLRSGLFHRRFELVERELSVSMEDGHISIPKEIIDKLNIGKGSKLRVTVSVEKGVSKDTILSYAGLLSDLTGEQEKRFDESVKRIGFIEGGL